MSPGINSNFLSRISFESLSVCLLHSIPVQLADNLEASAINIILPNPAPASRNVRLSLFFAALVNITLLLIHFLRAINSIVVLTGFLGMYGYSPFL